MQFLEVIWRESLNLAREAEDSDSCAAALINLGDVAKKQNDYAAVRAYLEEGLTYFRDSGEEYGIAMALNNLGEVAIAQKDYEIAHRRFQEALSLRWKLGDKRGITFSLRGLGDVRLGNEEAYEAVVLWGAADALAAEIGSMIAPDDQAHLEQKIAQSRAILCDRSAAFGERNAVFAAAWAEGRALNGEQAVRYALRAKGDCLSGSDEIL